MTGLAMRFIGHSTVRVELGGVVVLTDPVLASAVGPLRRMSRPPSRSDWADADLVLLSHLHGDHLHLPSLRGMRARVVVPRGAGGWLRARGVRRVDELATGEAIEYGGLRVTGVEARHSGHRWGPRSTRGPQAAAMGHLLEAPEGRVYAAGDTDLFAGMAELPPLDVALLPVWGWGPTLGPGHLDPSRAAEAVRRIRPRVAVPVHWGTLALAGLARAPGRWGARMRRLLVEPPREFAAAVAAAGTPTEVVVTEPGEPVELPGGPPVLTALADGATGTSAVGYAALFGGVLLGSVIPVVPTGALVGAAAAIAMSTGELSLPLVVLLATAAALIGDLLTVGLARVGGDAAQRWVARGQHPERLATAREQFTRHGWLLVVAGRLIPAGRVPVLLAAGALAYPWRRLLPAVVCACLLWAVAYAALGALTGGLFDDPLIAPLLAAGVVLLVGATSSLVAWLVRRRRERAAQRAPR